MNNGELFSFLHLRKVAHIVLFLFVAVFSGEAQKYFISFSDKNNNAYSINAPEKFLSPKAIDRRAKHHVVITEQDLPVTPSYLDSVRNMGVRVLWASKWLNGAIVESDHQSLMDTITSVSFVQDVKIIYSPTYGILTSKFKESQTAQITSLKSMGTYGAAWNQTQTLNGHYLHQNGFEGQGIEVAVIDNGFFKVNTLPLFSHLWNNGQILSCRDFVHPGGDIFQSDTHGTMVLSVMGGYLRDEFKGSAPEAKYHLLRTEDGASEAPIEEYNWVVAAEYADSIGVDIINTSVGYYNFIGDYSNYSRQDMDGQTTIVVQGAEIAFSKGMMVVCSAGNEGNSQWGSIISPSDGEHILAVAAMGRDSVPASFSGYGPSADGRVKPDVSAMGLGVIGQGVDGDMVSLNGTSFSTPLICGFAACLWQAHPQLKNTELLALIRESSHLFDDPDEAMGYGVPDFKKALDMNRPGELGHSIAVFPNPFDTYLKIKSTFTYVDHVSIYDVAGNRVYQQKSIVLPFKVDGLQNLPSGIYLIQVKAPHATFTRKIVKK